MASTLGGAPRSQLVNTDRFMAREWLQWFAMIRDAAAGAGNVTGPGSSTNNQIVLFSGTTGKLLAGATGTGVVHATAGVYSVGNVALASEVSGRLPYANFTQATAASLLLGRGSASGSGDWQEITLGAGMSMVGTTLSATNAITTVTVPLTDAEIKALPTTSKTLITAPGNGFRIRVLGATIRVDAANGAYTNLNATYVDLHAEIGGEYMLYGPVDDSTTAPALTGITIALGTVGYWFYDVLVPTAGFWGTSPGYVLANGSGAGSGVLPYASQNNTALILKADNNGSGNFTGGNALNTMQVIVYYTIEPV